MEAEGGVGTPELMREAESPAKITSSLAPADVTVEEPLHSPADEPPHSEEEDGVPVPNSGLLQVTERRQPLSSVSSLEVHFDLLDLTELTDMSDQELAEVFADSDDENESLPGLHHPSLPRGGYMRSPSWTRMKADHSREKKHLSDSEIQPGMVDNFLTLEKPKED
ncbi:hypothetical protein NDU88_003983 [Pleurodeles waltl]|uniref:Dysbindin domain-containing protein 1 n=1 Tax=Pleurodeles waltl TaxID=8319 RepID=A0AAV7KY27_PLEWA|nr:hypothetical protein NDU88_003983 [Pleurodeles waltl]